MTVRAKMNLMTIRSLGTKQTCLRVRKTQMGDVDDHDDASDPDDAALEADKRPQRTLVRTRDRRAGCGHTVTRGAPAIRIAYTHLSSHLTSISKLDIHMLTHTQGLT